MKSLVDKRQQRVISRQNDFLSDLLLGARQFPGVLLATVTYSCYVRAARNPGQTQEEPTANVHSSSRGALPRGLCSLLEYFNGFL